MPSKWSDTKWYAIWSPKSEIMEYKLPTKRLKNNQVFEIKDSIPFYITYKELNDLGYSNTINKIRIFYRNAYKDKKKNPTWDDLKQLETYLRSWKSDVDKYFSSIRFYKNEWLWPMIIDLKRVKQIIKVKK